MYFWDKHKTITGYYELLSGEVCDRYGLTPVSYTHLRAHETGRNLVCRLLLEKKKKKKKKDVEIYNN